MINLILWVVTVAVYFGVWCALKGNPASTGELLIILGAFTVLSAPFNINGNIWTVIGNAKSEKSIFSLFSLYQKAGNDAVAFVAVYQKAGNDAGALEAAGYQKAGNDAVAFVAVYQNAGNLAEALVVAGYQKAGKKERLLGIFSELKKK